MLHLRITRGACASNPAHLIQRMASRGGEAGEATPHRRVCRGQPPERAPGGLQGKQLLRTPLRIDILALGGTLAQQGTAQYLRRGRVEGHESGLGLGLVWVGLWVLGGGRVRRRRKVRGRGGEGEGGRTTLPET